MAAKVGTSHLRELHLGADRGLAHFGQALHLGSALAGDADLGEGYFLGVRASDPGSASLRVRAGRKLPRLLRLPQFGANTGVGEEHDQRALVLRGDGGQLVSGPGANPATIVP